MNKNKAVPNEVWAAWAVLERCYIEHNDEKELCAGEFAAYQRALLDTGMDEGDMARECAKTFGRLAGIARKAAKGMKNTPRE